MINIIYDLVYTLIAPITFWLVIALGQYYQGNNDYKLKVPQRLAKLCGSKTEYVHPGYFCLQLYWWIVWISNVPSLILFPRGEDRGDIFSLSLVTSAIIIFILHIILRFFRRKSDIA